MEQRSQIFIGIHMLLLSFSVERLEEVLNEEEKTKLFATIGYKENEVDDSFPEDVSFSLRLYLCVNLWR